MILAGSPTDLGSFDAVPRAGPTNALPHNNVGVAIGRAYACQSDQNVCVGPEDFCLQGDQYEC